jgi:hypothetical protein
MILEGHSVRRQVHVSAMAMKRENHRGTFRTRLGRKKHTGFALNPVNGPLHRRFGFAGARE